MFDILKDIKSGALPPSEYLGFIGYLAKKIFWIAIAIIGAGVVGYLLR